MHVSHRTFLGKAVLAASGVSALLAPFALAGSGASADEPRPAGHATPGGGAVITVTTAEVGAPGNRSVGVVPFQDAVYRSCADAPETAEGCLTVGRVTHPYRIGRLEVTVGQWVAFLNTVDPRGLDRHDLYNEVESPTAWPKYGQIAFSSDARDGRHYTVGYPAWANKPYGFATFLKAARLVNSLYNGRLISRRAERQGRFSYVTYSVALSARTERGMYDLTRPDTTRSQDSGFVVPSQDEWIKAAYYDPSGGGTYSYWKYPTNPGVFGDGDDTAPHPTVLNPTTGDVANAADQPLASYKGTDTPAPSWCPGQVRPDVCATVNPIGLDPVTYPQLYQGSLGTVGQAGTTSPWGTLDQGGNAVEWTDTITAPPSRRDAGRVWRRAHGGVSNAPAFQMWPSAVGLQPQDNVFFNLTYPWFGIRLGVVGDLKPGGS